MNRKIVITIAGIAGAKCVARLERQLAKVAGILRVGINPETERLTLEYDAALVSPAEISNFLANLGYPARIAVPPLELGQSSSNAIIRNLKRQFLAALVLSLPLIVRLLLSEELQICHVFYDPATQGQAEAFLNQLRFQTRFLDDWRLQLALATPIQWVTGWPVYQASWQAWQTRSVNRDLPVALGAAAAYFYSLYIALFVPADLFGNKAVYFEAAALVITLVLSGKYVAALALGKSSPVAEVALGGKTPLPRSFEWVDAFLVPAVVLIAVVTFFSWRFSATGWFEPAQALLAAVAVLVIAAPGALGLARSAALAVGIGRGAQHGILFKSGSSLATAARVQTLVWVRSGTDLSGKPSVTGVFPFDRTGRITAAALSSVQQLQRLGVKVLWLTGDDQQTAAALGEQVGSASVIAAALPEEKAAVITNLKQQGSVVAVVGNGITAASALAAADLGITIGSDGEAAVAAGGITLVPGNPLLIPAAVQLARRTMRKVKQNLVGAFIYHALAIPVAAAGGLPPVGAAGAMVFSTVAVILNSLSLHWSTLGPKSPKRVDNG